jgi:hypothetical protein
VFEGECLGEVSAVSAHRAWPRHVMSIASARGSVEEPPKVDTWEGKGNLIDFAGERHPL